MTFWLEAEGNSCVTRSLRVVIFSPFSSGYFGRFIDMSGFLFFYSVIFHLSLSYALSPSSPTLPSVFLVTVYPVEGSGNTNRLSLPCGFSSSSSSSLFSFCFSLPLFHTFPLYPVRFTFTWLPSLSLVHLTFSFIWHFLNCSNYLLSPPPPLPPLLSFSLSSLRSLVHYHLSTTTDPKWWTGRTAAPLAKNVQSYSMKCEQEWRFAFF